MNTRFFSTILILFPVLTSACFAQDQFDIPPKTISISVSPKAQPSPPMIYSFSRPATSNTKGNAADYYLQAAELQQSFSDQNLPVTTTDPNLIPDIINRYEPVDKLISTATGMSYCDWQLDYSNGLDVSTTGISNLNLISRTMHTIAKQKLASSDYAAALESIRRQLIMASDFADGNTTINTRISRLAIGRALAIARDLGQRSDSPSLYWPLMEYYLTFPDLNRGILNDNAIDEKVVLDIFKKDLETGYFTGIEMYEAVKAIFELTEDEEFPYGYYEYNGLLALYYNEALNYLTDKGLDLAKMKLMPPAQVVAISKWYQYTKLRDDYYKWFRLPYHIANPRIDQIWTDIRDYRKQQQGKMSFAFLLRTSDTWELYKATQCKVWLEAIINIEAIRLHIHQTSHLPGSLDEITIVPTLTNTFTGQPFRYELKDQTHALLFDDNEVAPIIYNLQ